MPLILLWIASSHAQSKLPRDNSGWTVFTPHAETKIIYVSSVGGDDATGIAYAPGSSEIGADPFLPQGGIKPFKTVAGAAGASRNGKPDWVLFKKGETWANETLPARSGLSEEAPFLYSAYGKGDRPLFKTGANTAYQQCCGNFNDIVLAHLDFYAHTRNPGSQEFVSMAGSPGFNFYLGDNFTSRGALIEGCRFRFYTGNVVQGPGTMDRFVIRRCAFLDSYSATSHCQGLYSANQSLTLEENFFDHNGWYRQAGPGLTRDDGVATMYNHNTYFEASHDVVFRGNMFLRASSIGNKWTADNGPASARNIEIDDNLYVDGEFGISMGGNETVPAHRFKNVSVTNNVMLDMGRSQPTNRTLGWYLDIDDWDQGEASGNYFLHVTNPKVTNVWGIRVLGEVRDVSIHDNVIYGLNTPESLLELTDGSVKTNVSIARNILDNRNANGKMIRLQGSPINYSFSSNRYYGTLDPSNWFDLAGNAVALSQWAAQSGETGSQSGPAAFPDPTRNIGKYLASLQRDTAFSEFIAGIRDQSKDNWDTALTAAKVNAWIRAGFNGNPVAVQPHARGQHPTSQEIAAYYRAYDMGGRFRGRVVGRNAEIPAASSRGLFLLVPYDAEHRPLAAPRLRVFRIE